MAAQRLQKLLALGRRDKRISPSPEASSGRDGALASTQQQQETGTEVQQTEAPRTKDAKNTTKDEKKRQKQEALARQKKEATGNSSTLKREKKHLRQGVRDDLKSTPLETWATFTFTAVVGTILLGGGVALIVFGKRNTVTDFIVVGVCGILMGVCFSIVGSFVVFRPVYNRRVERKRVWREEKRKEQLQTKPQASLPSAVVMTPQTVVHSAYFNQGQEDLLTQQLSDTRRQRRPSNAELYGNEDDEPLPDTYAVTLDPPPPLALPNPRATDSSTPEEEAVQHVHERETTDDDIIVIAKAARHGNVVPATNADRDLDLSGLSVNDLAIEQSSRQDSPIKFRESPVQVIVTHADIDEESRLCVDNVLPEMEEGRRKKDNRIHNNPTVDVSGGFNDDKDDHSKGVPVAFHYDAGGVTVDV